MQQPSVLSPNGLSGLRINMARLRDDIEALSRIGRTTDGALARYAFSPGYEKARAWLKARMREAGMRVRDDAAGNTIGRIGPEGAPCVMAGSHIDTVPDGGPLDGALGVLAALEIARVIRDADMELPLAFECVAFIEEEGRFLGRMGSKALVGMLDQGSVEKAVDPSGYRLTEAMRAAGFDPSTITRARRTADEICAYVELHIEQGPVLDQLGVPIGIVEAIVATSHARVVFEGEPDHVGTAPMDLRKDAFTGAAEYACLARQLVLDEGTKGQGRITFGVVDLKPQVANIVPYQVVLLQDIRDISDSCVARMVAGTKDIAEQVATKHRLTVRYEPLSEDAAAIMSDRVRTPIREAATALNLPTHDMPSGAAHDAQVMARLVPAGMIFVPSAGGRSHRRDEWTDWSHLEQGANALLHTLLRLLPR
ncbi:MAG: Zn-dependent hydrolase [Acidiferrobacterales bacterium]|nr:Zn-dependent hydrolase [Acidiferrobacterales bacterium]